MADDGSENIGGVNISIGADYSDLKDAFSDAQQAAAAAGDSIAQSFTTAASATTDFDSAVAALVASGSTLESAIDQCASMLEEVGTSADTAAGSVSGFGDAAAAAGGAADDAAGGIGGMSDAANEAAESAGEAGSKLGEMAEGLLAVGEALAITEGLKEFGSEALTAADNVTHASIALTTLTGSGEAANTTIEGLEQLGMSDGLAFPSLLTAGTRMQAMLGPTADVTAQLALVADGAALMGTDIVSAAARFDQMATAGTASVRTMQNLGLSLQSLATAMDQVDPSADATASTVSEMFKTMEQTDRIQVLDTALQKLGGTAEQVANQTFSGQWQELADAWDATMEQVGQALLPVIADLVQFTKTDIVPFITNTVEAFNQLPGPIKDVVVAAGVLAAAAVPVTAGLAAIGLGVQGLQNLLPAATGLLRTFGITASTTAAEAEAAGVEVGGLGAILGGVLVIGIGAAVFSLIDLKMRLDQAHSSVQGLTDADFSKYITGVVTSATSTQELAAASAKVTQAFAEGIITQTQYNALLMELDTKEKAAVGNGFSEYLTSIGANLHIVTDASGELQKGIVSLTETTQQQTAAYQQSKAVYDAVLNSYELGIPMSNGVAASAHDVDVAYQGLTSSANAAGIAIAPMPGTMAAINDAALALGPNTNTLAAAQQLSADAAVSQQAHLFDLNTTLDTDQAKVMLLTSQYRDWQQAQDGSTSATKNLQTAEENLVTSEVKLINDRTQMTIAQQDMVASQAIMTAGIGTEGAALAVLSNELGQSQAKLQQQVDLMNTGEGSATKYAAAVKTVEKAQEDLDAAQAVANTGLQGNTAAWAGAEMTLAAAKAKLDDVTAAYKAGEDTYNQYATAATAVLNAQIAVDENNAAAATGVQSLTDQYSEAVIELATAQAKLQDVTTAYQNQKVSLDVLVAAQNAVTTAQKNLDTQQAASPSIIDATTASIIKNTAALNAQYTQQVANTEALQDFLGIGNGAGTSPMNLSAQSGYTLKESPSTGMGGIVITEVPLPATALALQEQQDEAAAAQQANPKNLTDPATLAAVTLAVAQAALKDLSASYSSGSGLVTAEQLQSAQSAVTTAQAAVAAAQASASAIQNPSATSGTTSPTSMTSTTNSTATASTATAAAAPTGGSYIYQAPGSIFLVELVDDQGTPVDIGTATAAAVAASSNGSTPVSDLLLTLGGGTVSTAAGTATAATASAADTADAMTAAAASMQTVAGAMQQLGQAVVSSAAAVTASASQISWEPLNLTGSTSSTTSATAPAETLSIGTTPVAWSDGYAGSYTGGGYQAPVTGSLPGIGPDMAGPIATPSRFQTAAPAATAAPVVNANFQGANFANSNPNAVQQAVLQGMTRALRTAGARF